MWPTIAVQESKNNAEPSQFAHNTKLLNVEAIYHSYPNPKAIGTEFLLLLNLQFVERLIGWHIGGNAFALVEMVSPHWLPLMLGEFLQLQQMEEIKTMTDLKSDDLKIEYMPVDDLIPYAQNVRVHSETQVVQITASKTEFSFVSLILLGDNNVIIAGHGRLMAVKMLVVAQIPVIFLKHLNEAQCHALVIADNKIAKMLVGMKTCCARNCRCQYINIIELMLEARKLLSYLY